MWADLRLDLSLANALIEVTDEKLGVLESMRNLNVSIRKEAGALDLVLALDAAMHRPGAPQAPGRLSVRADVDITGKRPSKCHLETTGFDLARYRPLLAWGLSANPFQDFAGVLSGKCDATMQPDGSTTVSGKLVLAQPHFRTVGEDAIEVRSDAFVLEPNVAFDLGDDTRPEKLDLRGFRIDLGFFRATGIPGPEAARLAQGKPSLGLRYTVDLGALTKIGGPVPKELRGTPGRVTGQVLFTPDGNSPDLQALRMAAEVLVDHLNYQGYAVRNLRGDLAIAEGKVSFQTRDGGTLNGGRCGSTPRPPWTRNSTCRPTSMCLGRGARHAVMRCAGCATQCRCWRVWMWTPSSTSRATSTPPSSWTDPFSATRGNPSCSG